MPCQVSNRSEYTYQMCRTEDHSRSLHSKASRGRPCFAKFSLNPQVTRIKRAWMSPLQVNSSARIIGERGDFPHCGCQSPPLFVFLVSSRRGGAVFVLGTAGGTRITDKYSSTSTSHVTRLMIINLSASILIIALVLLINITFINRR